MLPGCLVLTLFSSGGEKCSWCPLLPLPKQVVTTDNQSHHRGAFPTSSTPGHQGGVRHHADTGGRTVRQQHHPEVTHSLFYHCGLLNLTAITMTVCCLFFYICHYVCCSAQKESKKANMKRENKAYSYKEQIIELELQEVKCPLHH